MCKKPDFLIFPVVAEHFLFFGYFAIFVGDFFSIRLWFYQFVRVSIRGGQRQKKKGLSTGVVKLHR